MSAAVTRTNRVELDTNEFTQRAETGIPVKLEARPVVEDHGMTPLMRAACDGSAGTVQALLDRGAEVNAKRSDGFNALALAAFFGHSQVVWLLLENGADLAATGRSETLPEMWADMRGFVDIGDILREARATKQVMEAPNPGTAAIAEPGRFPRPAENEKPQRTNVPDARVECSVIDVASDSETTLVRPAPPEECTLGKSESTGDLLNDKPTYTQEPPVLVQPPRAGLPGVIEEVTDSEITLVTPAPVTEGNSVRESESTGDVIANATLEHVQEQPVITQPLRVLRTLPEIQDPPPLVVPEFHPGSAFVARITSSRKTLITLVVAVWLAFSCVAYFLIPQIRKSLAGMQTEAGTKTTTLVTEPSGSVAGSETTVSEEVETPSAAPTESTSAPAANEIEEVAADSTTDTTANTKNFESASRVDSVEVSEKSAPGNGVSTGSESRAHTGSFMSAGNSLPEARENKREFTSTTSMSRSAASARKKRAVSRVVKFEQQTAGEEPPKPAPLSVEVSRSRSLLSTPARSASEVPGSQPPPLNIISGKPKSKVIQWP